MEFPKCIKCFQLAYIIADLNKAKDYLSRDLGAHAKVAGCEVCKQEGARFQFHSLIILYVSCM